MIADQAEFEYDVAVSFLAEDEVLARQIADELAPLGVFVYSKAQEELAGRDGIEAFGHVFRQKTRLVLVLFRERWGQTRWTRVEETAIKDRCFEDGWDSLFLVRLNGVDVSVRGPKWVPKTHIYFDLSTFTLPELAGAVKARVRELGGSLRALTAVERAARLAKREEFDGETRNLLNASPEPFLLAAEALFDELESKCER